MKVSCRQLGLPALPRSDGGCVVEEAVFFFLLGQPGEFRVERVLRCEESLFAVQDRRVEAGVVFEAIDLAGAEGELDGAEQRRVRVGFEVGVGVWRSLITAVPLDSVQSLAKTNDQRAGADSTCPWVKGTFNVAETEDK
jgi:hypothetical protein